MAGCRRVGNATKCRTGKIVLAEGRSCCYIGDVEAEETAMTQDTRTLEEIYKADGYKAAKAEAERRGVIWSASAGATRKPHEAEGRG